MTLRLYQRHCPYCCMVTDHVVIGHEGVDPCTVCGYSEKLGFHVKNQYGFGGNTNIYYNGSNTQKEDCCGKPECQRRQEISTPEIFKEHRNR